MTDDEVLKAFASIGWLVASVEKLEAQVAAINARLDAMEAKAEAHVRYSRWLSDQGTGRA